MKISVFRLSTVLLVFIVFVAGLRGAPAGSVPGNSSGPGRPELEYFKAINSVAPPQDPQILFLLMGQYSNANLQNDGVEFFTARLKEFGPRLTDAQKSLYLSAIGLLRAQNASSVSFLHRIGYVKDTIAILEQARQLSGGQIFVVKWSLDMLSRRGESLRSSRGGCTRSLVTNSRNTISWSQTMDES